MTGRLVRYWVVLWRELGLNPHRCDEWTLDEAITAEIFCEDYETEQRRQAAAARRRR